MAIQGKVRKVVAEDIDFGTSTVSIQKADGTIVTANQVNASQLPTSDDRNVENIIKGVGYSIDEFTDLADAVVKIGSQEGTLIIHKSITLNQDLTIPENICLKFLKGGKITVNSGYTLTINGSIESGLWQIFDGDGTITGNPQINWAYPEWFGAVGDGNIDDSNALNRTFLFFNKVKAQQNYFCAGNLINIPIDGVLEGNHFKNVRFHLNNNITIKINEIENNFSTFTPLFSYPTSLQNIKIYIKEIHDTSPDSNLYYEGYINFDNLDLSNFEIIVNSFYIENTECNCIMIKAHSDLGLFVRDGFIKINVEKSNRMGIEIQNSVPDEDAYGYYNITIKANLENIAAQGLSFSGRGKNIYAEIICRNVNSYCLEGVCIDNSYLKVIGYDSNTLISFSGTSNNFLIINAIGKNCSAAGNLHQVYRSFININCESINCLNLRGSYNFISANLKTQSVYAMYLELSHRNFITGILDNTEAATNYSTIRFYGSECYDNIFLGKLYKPSTGGYYSQIDGAYGNIINYFSQQNVYVIGRTFSVPHSFTDGDTTPSVADGNFFITQNTSSTSITFFDNGITGQKITVLFKDSNTTIIHGQGIYLKSGSNETIPANTTKSFIFDGTYWYEI